MIIEGYITDDTERAAPDKRLNKIKFGFFL